MGAEIISMRGTNVENARRDGEESRDCAIISVEENTGWMYPHAKSSSGLVAPPLPAIAPSGFSSCTTLRVGVQWGYWTVGHEATWVDIATSGWRGSSYLEAQVAVPCHRSHYPFTTS